VAQRPSRLTLVDAAVHRFLVHCSILVPRWAVGVVFVYFGALKLLTGHSPAESLVMETIKTMTFDVVPGRAGVAITGTIERALAGCGNSSEGARVLVGGPVDRVHARWLGPSAGDVVDVVDRGPDPG